MQCSVRLCSFVLALLVISCTPTRLAPAARSQGLLARTRTSSSKVGARVFPQRTISPQLNIIGEILQEVKTELNGTIVELPVMFDAGDQDFFESFDFDRWDLHRSNSRYGRLLVGIFFGPTTRKVFPTVGLVTLFSFLVDAYNTLVARGTFTFLPELQLPITPFELTAPVLGLLLVFRTDTANSRFCQGSEVAWEVTSSIRSLIRRLLVFSSGDNHTDEDRLAAMDLIAASCKLHDWIMGRYLKRMTEADRIANVDSHLDLMRTALGVTPGETSDQELARLFGLRLDQASQRQVSPHTGITAISLGFKQRFTSLTDQEAIALDDCLVTVTDALAKCEKLLRTPIPLGYARSAVRFLWLWLSLLPFALVRTFSDFGVDTWWDGKPQPVLELAIFFISFIFLSIEDIAVQIEEPFAILPLELHQQWLTRDAEQALKLQRWSSERRLKRNDEKAQRGTQ